MSGNSQLIGLLSVVSAIVLAICCFKFLWITNTRFRRIVIGICISFFTTLLLFLFIEFIFSTFFISSDSFAASLSSKRWFNEYWKPINSYGYRDVEHSPEAIRKKALLFIVGDSFAAGHGIEYINNRFGDILAKDLGTLWEMILIAKNGWNTVDQINAVKKYPAHPRILVLSYFINDILGSVKSLGLPTLDKLPEPPRFINFVISRSYIFDTLYWKIRRSRMTSDYWSEVRRFYATDAVWNIHSKELISFVEYSRNQNALMVALLWPHLPFIEESKPLLDRVEHLFLMEKVPVVNLAEYFSGRSPDQLIISDADLHPNILVHAEVAHVIFKRIKQLERSR